MVTVAGGGRNLPETIHFNKLPVKYELALYLDFYLQSSDDIAT